MAGQILRDKKENRTGSRKPLCIGLTLLAIGTILAGVLLPMYFLEITPFDKDGTAPSPPPPIPVASTSASTVKFELIAEGAVTDYTDAKKASIAENVASELGVNVADVTVTVTAASVKITVEVKTDTPDITKAALETKVASPTTASALLGGDVVVTSVANAVFDVPSPPPTAASPPPTGSSVAPGLKTVAGLTTVEATGGSRRQLRNLGRFASVRPNPNPSPNRAGARTRTRTRALNRTLALALAPTLTLTLTLDRPLIPNKWSPGVLSVAAQNRRNHVNNFLNRSDANYIRRTWGGMWEQLNPASPSRLVFFLVYR